MLFGLPVDLYISLSIIYGSALGLFFWRLTTKHPRVLVPFLFVLPFCGLLRDYLISKATGKTLFVWDNSYWWVYDFIAWVGFLGITLPIWKKLFHRDDKPR